MSAESLVLFEREGATAIVTMNEPERRNPLSPGLVSGLRAAFVEAQEDDSISAVVLTGAGKGFSAGADLKRMREASPTEDREEYDDILKLNELMWGFEKPTIGAVRGFAFGAGANLMTWCDLVVVEEGTQIGYPEVRAGVPSATVIPTLQRLAGRRRMLEVTLLGEPITPQQAVAWGLANWVVPQGHGLEKAKSVAERISANEPSAVQTTKYISRVTSEMSYREAMTFAKEVRVVYRTREGFGVRVAQGATPTSLEPAGATQ